MKNQDYVQRVDYLRRVPATARFLSCEPLLGPLDLELRGIHWVIVGGESGPKHRKIEAEWVRHNRDRRKCRRVPAGSGSLPNAVAKETNRTRKTCV